MIFQQVYSQISKNQHPVKTKVNNSTAAQPAELHWCGLNAEPPRATLTVGTGTCFQEQCPSKHPQATLRSVAGKSEIH